MRPRRPHIAPATPHEPDPAPRRGFIATLAAGLAGLALIGRPRRAEAGLDPFIGEIMLFAGNFAPRGWAFCDGQILSISQNTALFSLLGTTYGGNGVTTFALPDLRGRAPVHFGQGAGLSSYVLGQKAGVEAVTLGVNEIPAHTHQAFADANNGTTDSPVGALPARNPAGMPVYGTTANAAMAAGHLATVGGGQPHTNLPPYLVLNYCIALTGIFPSRP